jgi:subtilisin family serine protease
VTIIGADQSPAPPYQARCPGTVPPPWWNPDNTGAGALAGMIAVGATDSSDVIASFSSHGPVTWMNVTPYNDFVYPPGLTKPEVVAPGVNIKSLSRTGGYVQMSGVSWACAHAAGAIALLLSRDSMMSPVAVDSVLELSAVPLGAPRKDNVYGAGRINVYAAVGLAEAENRESGIQKRSPTVVRGILRVPVSSRFVHYSLFDQTGRAVASLNSGSNDLSRLAPGVYFLRCAGESGSAAGHEVLVLR